MPLTTDARTDLADALANIGPTVHAVPPAVPTPPCLVIAPDTPWATIRRLGSRLNMQVRLRILIVVSPRTVEAAISESETLLEGVLVAIPAAYSVEDIGPPVITDTGTQGAVVTTEISVTVHMKED